MYMIIGWFSRAFTATGACPPQWDLRRDKSGIRAGRPRVSIKSCLSRVLLMKVLCTTSIRRRLRGYLGVASFLHFLDRAIEPKL